MNQRTYTTIQSRLDPLPKESNPKEYYTYEYTSRGQDFLIPPGSLRKLQHLLPDDLPDDMYPVLSNTWTAKISQQVLNAAQFGKEINTTMFTSKTPAGLPFIPDSTTPALTSDVPSKCICHNIHSLFPQQAQKYFGCTKSKFFNGHIQTMDPDVLVLAAATVVGQHAIAAESAYPKGALHRIPADQFPHAPCAITILPQPLRHRLRLRAKFHLICTREGHPTRQPPPLSHHNPHGRPRSAS